MKKQFLLSAAMIVAAVSITASPAWSAPVTATGATFSFTFDDMQFADTAVNAPGALSNISLPGNMADSDLFTIAGVGPNDIGQIGFTDNVLGNDAGVDLLIFEGGATSTSLSISLTEGGTEIVATLLGQATNISIGGRNPFIHAIDLSDFGLLNGVTLTSDIFLRAVDGTSAVQDIAALNTGMAVVPLPFTLPLLLSGLGWFGLIGWRNKRRTD